jgi:hypothetical protein
MPCVEDSVAIGKLPPEFDVVAVSFRGASKAADGDATPALARI